jgi:hypothetical protein
LSVGYGPKDRVFEKVDLMSDRHIISSAERLIKNKTYPMAGACISKDLALSQLLYLDDVPEDSERLASMNHIFGRFPEEFWGGEEEFDTYKKIIEEKKATLTHTEKSWRALYLLLWSVKFLHENKNKREGGNSEKLRGSSPIAADSYVGNRHAWPLHEESVSSPSRNGHRPFRADGPDESQYAVPNTLYSVPEAPYAISYAPVPWDLTEIPGPGMPGVR